MLLIHGQSLTTEEIDINPLDILAKQGFRAQYAFRGIWCLIYKPPSSSASKASIWLEHEESHVTQVIMRDQMVFLVWKDKSRERLSSQAA
jgi:hypothetical protein